MSFVGTPRSRTAVEEDLEALLSLLEELPGTKIQELRTRIVNQQTGLLVPAEAGTGKDD